MTERTPATVRFRGVEVRVRGASLLAAVDWTVRPGERWVVVGPNGAGKTTLLRLAAGYLHPTRGEVVLLGERLGATDVRRLRPRIGYLSAALRTLVRDDLAARDVVSTAAAGALDPFWTRAVEGAATRERTAALLGRFGATALAGRTMGSLSSGEQQRVQLARALLPDPELLLLDEPFAGLDLGARAELLASLADLATLERPAAIVLVVHHLEEIPRGFDRALLLAGGRVVAQGPAGRVLTGARLSEAYGRPLRVRVDAAGARRVDAA